MKRGAANPAAALDHPDPATRFYLFSGADQSASRLSAERLLKTLAAEKVGMTGAQLKADPSGLAAEATTIAMFGDRRLLWIEPAGEEIAPAVSAYLALPQVEAPALAIVPSALKKDSNLKKLVEAHAHTLHLASEPLSPRDQALRIMELGLAEGLTVSPELAGRIAEEANGDLLLARLELQKFALYLDASLDRVRELDEECVALLGIDQAEADFNRPGDLALAGDLSGLAAELRLLDQDAIDPIPVVRALQRRLLMLAPLLAKVEQGQRPEAIAQGVWKRDRASVARILPRWNVRRLSDAFGRVQQLEREILLRPVPGQAALGETLFQLARVAAAGRR